LPLSAHEKATNDCKEYGTPKAIIQLDKGLEISLLSILEPITKFKLTNVKG